MIAAATARALAMAGALGVLPHAVCAAPAQNVIHAFQGQTPAGLLRSKNELLGATFDGGQGYGSVYRLAPPSAGAASWSMDTLYMFGGESDGAYLTGPLSADKAGNLYGTTQGGGTGSCAPEIDTHCGTLFKLVRPPSGQTGFWIKQTIFDFQTPVHPTAQLAIDEAGRVYLPIAGTVAQFSPGAPPSEWTQTTIFSDPAYQIRGSLVRDSRGKLYGVAGTTDAAGSAHDLVFQLTPPSSAGKAWTHRVVASWGVLVSVGQIAAPSPGVIYGTTAPTRTNCSADTCAVFELSQAVGQTAWTKQILHDFAGDAAGRPGYGYLSTGADGSIFGQILPPGINEDATIYRLTPPAAGQTAWAEAALLTFKSMPNAYEAGDPMVVTDRGDVFGTAVGGYTDNGIAFKVVRGTPANH